MRRANGDGSVFYDEKRNVYRGQITTGYDERGKLRRKSVTGKTKTEVKQKLAQIKAAVYVGDFLDDSHITVYQLAKQLEDDKLNYNDIKETTYYRNMETLKLLAPIGSTPIQRITEAQLKHFMQSLISEYSNSMISKAHQMLGRTFKEAVKRDIIKKNPMIDVRCPKSAKATQKVRALTVTEQQRLVNVLTTEDVPFTAQMLISLYTGMRMGEINALTAQDIDFTRRDIYIHRTISKGAKGEAIVSDTAKTEAGTRHIPIPPQIENIFREAVNVAPFGFLFHSKNNTHVTTNQINMQLKRVLDKYDILDPVSPYIGKVTIHSLRHTYATRIIESGVPANILQKLLGHTDIRITLDTYCEVFDSFRDKELDKAASYFDQLGLNPAAALG